MTRYRPRLAALGLCLAAALAAAAPPGPPAPDPAQPGTASKSNAVSYEVDFSVIVTAPEGTKLLKVWLPLPPSDEGQQVRGRDLTTFPVAVEPAISTEPVYGNTFAYFEFPKPAGAQVIRHRFGVTVHQQDWGVDPKLVTRPATWPASFAPYLRADDAVGYDAAIAKLAADITADTTGTALSPAGELDKLSDWLQANMTYDGARGSLTADARYALRSRTGHCSDYHGLCAAFGRSLGTPTRLVYGVQAFAKNSPTHCKLEAFLPPYGWVSFDVSETQKLVKLVNADGQLPPGDKAKLAAAATARLKRGFRDNTWILLTRGTDYDLAPKASKRVPLVRTAYVEADGAPLPDPAPDNPAKREFAWMTAHQYKADRLVTYPFKDWSSLAK